MMRKRERGFAQVLASACASVYAQRKRSTHFERIRRTVAICVRLYKEPSDNGGQKQGVACLGLSIFVDIHFAVRASVLHPNAAG